MPLEELTKRYPGQGRPAVTDLSMDIEEGEIVVLVGPSGCGKTTTMKMINRIIEPTSGRIFLDGEDVTKTQPRPAAAPDRLRHPADRPVPAPDHRREHRDRPQDICRAPAKVAR